MDIQLTFSAGCGQSPIQENSTGDTMYGRYSIYEPMDHCLKELAPKQLVINGYDLCRLSAITLPRRRARPTEKGLRVDKVKWGWAPLWAKGKEPDPINARVETIMGGKFFKQL